MKTTLNKIRACSPCSDGWTKLLKNLGKTKGDDELLAITTILDSNGLDDALWCLRAVEGHRREMRLYAVDCARSVQHLITTSNCIEVIDVADRHADGLATGKELSAAWLAAWLAAESASLSAARSAAESEAWSAARSAALSEAWSAALLAARWASWSASLSAARSAAESEAWSAARSAAESEAWSTALLAARWASWSASLSAARSAAIEVQADLLRIVCAEIEQRSE